MRRKECVSQKGEIRPLAVGIGIWTDELERKLIWHAEQDELDSKALIHVDVPCGPRTRWALGSALHHAPPSASSRSVHEAEV